MLSVKEAAKRLGRSERQIVYPLDFIHFLGWGGTSRLGWHLVGEGVGDEVA